MAGGMENTLILHSSKKNSQNEDCNCSKWKIEIQIKGLSSMLHSDPYGDMFFCIVVPGWKFCDQNVNCLRTQDSVSGANSDPGGDVVFCKLELA